MVLAKFSRLARRSTHPVKQCNRTASFQTAGKNTSKKSRRNFANHPHRSHPRQWAALALPVTHYSFRVRIPPQFVPAVPDVSAPNRLLFVEITTDELIWGRGEEGRAQPKLHTISATSHAVAGTSSPLPPQLIRFLLCFVFASADQQGAQTSEPSVQSERELTPLAQLFVG